MTTSASSILERAHRVVSILGERTAPAFEVFTQDFGDLQETDVPAIQVAAAFDPQPIGLAHLFKRMPYTNPERFKSDLRRAVTRGWLASEGDGIYRLTDKGCAFFEGALSALDEIYRATQTLPDEDMQRLLGLLAVIVETAMTTRVFSEKPGLSMGRKLEPPADAPALSWARRHLISLLAFRDDAHVAAWTNLEIDGRTMESYTFLWKDEAHTALELASVLGEYRGYDEAAYTEALNQLASLGWATGEDGYYDLTEAGRSLRGDVERLTDVYFEAVFLFLEDEELVELEDLLGRLVSVLEVETSAIV